MEILFACGGQMAKWVLFFGCQARGFVEGIQFTVMIPIAYSLAKDLGWTMGVSGLWLGFDGFGTLVAAVLGRWVLEPFVREYWMRRTIVLLSPMMPMFAFLVLAWMLFENVGTTSEIIAALFFARFFAGFNRGLSAFSDQLTKVGAITQSEQATLSLLTMISVMCGLSLGPALCSAAIMIAGGYSYVATVSEAAAPVSAVSVLYAFLVLITTFTIPPKSVEYEFEDAYGMYPSGEDTDADSAPVAEGPTRPRIFLGLAVFALCSISCTSIEVGSSLILEVQYGWSVWGLGVILTVVYCISSMFALGLHQLAESEKIRHKWLSIIGTVVAFVGCCCLCGSGAYYQILIGDLMIYPWMVCLAGLGLNNVYGAAIPGSFFSTTNLNLSTVLLNSIAKLAGAPFARALISSLGRNWYGSYQIVVVVTSGFLVSLQVDKAQPYGKFVSLLSNTKRKFKDCYERPFKNAVVEAGEETEQRDGMWERMPSTI